MNLSEARKLLGVRSNSESAAINRAYRRRVFRVHPDRNPGDPDAHAKLVRLSEARDVALHHIGVSHGVIFQQPAYRPAPPASSDPFFWTYTPTYDPARRTVFDDLFEELRKSAAERGTAETFDSVFSILGRTAKRAQDEGRSDPTGIGVLFGLGLLTSWLRRR